MTTSFRYYRSEHGWITPTGKPATDHETELLNEIELLRWELDTLNTKLANLLKRVDL